MWPFSASTHARSRRGTLANCLRMVARGILCHASWTAIRSSRAFWGMGSIILIRRDIIDQMFSIMLRSGLFAGHRRTSIAAFVKKLVVICAVWGVAPSCMKIGRSARAWLSICGSTSGLRISSIYFLAVKPPWMSTKSSLQSLLTHTHTFTDMRGTEFPGRPYVG